MVHPLHPLEHRHRALEGSAARGTAKGTVAGERATRTRS